MTLRNSFAEYMPQRYSSLACKSVEKLPQKGHACLKMGQQVNEHIIINYVDVNCHSSLTVKQSIAYYIDIVLLHSKSSTHVHACACTYSSGQKNAPVPFEFCSV